MGAENNLGAENNVGAENDLLVGAENDYLAQGHFKQGGPEGLAAGVSASPAAGGPAVEVEPAVAGPAVLLGHPWDPRGFLEAAKALQHPFTAASELPARIQDAVFAILARGPDAVLRHRQAQLAWWRGASGRGRWRPRRRGSTRRRTRTSARSWKAS
eukprot:10277581-Lingulodinium_polyedra.AAC.1